MLFHATDSLCRLHSLLTPPEYTMKTPSILALVALSGTAAAFAAPRESVTFTNVESFGRFQQTGDGNNPNPTLTHTFTGSDGGGAYTARYLTISGQLTRISVNTNFSESTIYCVPPSGTPFLIQPFKTVQNATPEGPTVTVAAVPTGAYTIPVGSFTTAGEWSFLFYERFNDIAGRDAVWDTVTITLDDGPPPAPAPIGAMGQTFNNFLVNQPDGGGFVGSFTLPTGMIAGGVRIRAQGTGTMTPNANTRLTPTNNVRVRITTPDGVPLAPATVFPTASPSTDIGEVLVSLPANRDSAGQWQVEAFTNVNGHEIMLHSLAVELVPPTLPAATNLGTLVPNVQLNGAATVTAAGQTKWFRFTLNNEIQPAVNAGLQIDTEGSTTVDGTAMPNTSVGLYTAAGTLVGSDFVDGSASLGMLSFGIDNHPAPGDGQIYNGRDGANVVPGEYYVAVTAGDTGVAYQPGVFAVVNSSTQTGAIALHVRLVDPGATLPASVDAGVITGNAGGSERITNSAVSFTGPNQVKWIKFTTANDTAEGYFLDIYTSPADSADYDSEIGVYTPDGLLIMSDDDDGIDYSSFLAYGVGGGATIGDAGNGGAPVTSDGRDGHLSAGDYYLAVAPYNAAFGNQLWTVTTNGTDLGNVPVHFASNLPPQAACGPADIGAAGGEPGSDEHLDNNDFIAFITFFFEQNAIADMGVAGGEPGSDSTWDNNDFIAFINHFFAGPASCR